MQNIDPLTARASHGGVQVHRLKVFRLIPFGKDGVEAAHFRREDEGAIGTSNDTVKR